MQYLWCIKYYQFQPGRIGYSYRWAKSREEVAEYLDNVPVDPFIPDGQTYSQHFISITKVDGITPKESDD